MADNRNNRVLWILHTVVFLAGWTGIFGRLISLAGLPLVRHGTVFMGNV